MLTDESGPIFVESTGGLARFATGSEAVDAAFALISLERAPNANAARLSSTRQSVLAPAFRTRKDAAHREAATNNAAQ